MLNLAQKAYWAYKYGDTIYCICYGAPRIGKSAWSIQNMQDLGLKTIDDLKPYLVYRPSEFVELGRTLQESGDRARVIVWDDAGMYMFSLDWNDQRVKDALKMIQVAGTLTALLIFTTPSPGMMLKKLMNMDGMNFAHVVRDWSNIRCNYKANPFARRADLFSNYLYPWGKKHCSKYGFDEFDCMVDDELYRWYKPLRDSYTKEALEQMARKYKLDHVPTEEEAVALADKPISLPVTAI